MTTHYGDFQGFVTSEATAYPISYSGSGLFDMSPLAEDMMDLLPSYFFLGNNNRRIMELIAVILADYENRIDEVRDQFFVETATWGLVYWEQLVGLPINADSLDYEARRAAILNKLRDCSSEKCFVEGIENIINGQVIVIDLDPVRNPYQISIELRSIDLTFAGPLSNPTAATSGTGPLTGDYTYRVTYEFEPVELPDFITLFPYSNSSGLYGSVDIIGQRQFVKVTGVGSFWLTMGGLETSAGPFTETSTAEDIVDALVVLLEPKYGEDAVSTAFSSNVVGTEGVILIFEGLYTKGLSLPILEIVNVTGSISGTPVIVNNPEFIQPPLTGETPSGIMPTKINEIQELFVPFTNPTSGTFTIKYNTIWDESQPPIFETTDPLPYNATPDQIAGALYALPSIYPNSLSVTSGGSLPLLPVSIEFTRVESGFPQALFVIDNTSLVGGTFDVSRTQAGTTTYSGSESNTVTAVANSILLTNVPKSPDGASKRNIYRKKTAAPYNEWRFVGSIDDNYNTLFLDDVDDVDLSETQELQIFGTGTFKLRFDSVDTVTLSQSSSQATVDAALDAIITGSYPNVEVTVTGTSPSYTTGGMVIKFDAGDVEGKDVPKMEIVDTSGVTGYVISTGPRKLTEKNTAFTYTFQRLLEYIYVTKPAHLRIRALRSAAFRASINKAGDSV